MASNNQKTFLTKLIQESLDANGNDRDPAINWAWKRIKTQIGKPLSPEWYRAFEALLWDGLRYQYHAVSNEERHTSLEQRIRAYNVAAQEGMESSKAWRETIWDFPLPGGRLVLGDARLKDLHDARMAYRDLEVANGIHATWIHSIEQAMKEPKKAVRTQFTIKTVLALREKAEKQYGMRRAEAA